MFYKDPCNDQTAMMRDRILRCKFDQYLNALAHIMNTGEDFFQMICNDYVLSEW